MNWEIILLTGFGLAGKQYGYLDTQMNEDELTLPSEFNGTKVKLVYKDTNQTKYYRGKPRRIFDLNRMTKDE